MERLWNRDEGRVRDAVAVLAAMVGVLVLYAADSARGEPQETPGTMVSTTLLTLEASAPCAEIARYGALTVDICLRNVGAQGVDVQVLPSGLPAGVSAIIVGPAGTRESNNWLAAGSEAMAVPLRLEPSASVRGRELVVFVRADVGFAFAEPGTYTVEILVRMDGHGELRAQPIRVDVRDDGANEELLRKLMPAAFAYYDYSGSGGDRFETVLASGVIHRLLWHIIDHDKPFRVDPARGCGDVSEAALVGALEELLQDASKSGYHPYIARFLGLVYWEEAERTLPEETMLLEPAKLRELDAYQKATRYLAMSEKPCVWRPEIAQCYEAILRYVGDEKTRCTAVLQELKGEASTPESRKAAEEAERNIRKWDEKKQRALDRRNAAPAPG